MTGAARGRSGTRWLAGSLAIATFLALGSAVPAMAGDLSVSIVGDGYAVRPGYGGEIIYYGPPSYVAPPVYPGYAWAPPARYYGAPTPFGYYGPPPVYGYGGVGPYGYGPPFLYGRRALRLPR